MRAVYFAPLLVASALGLGACVDSELSGIADTTALPDVLVQDLLQDIAGDDVSDADATPPDAVDAGCTTNAQCVPVLGPLTACEQATCDPARGLCFAARRADCCVTTADCPASASACLDYVCPTPGGRCEPRDLCPPCQLDSDCQAQAPACTQGRCAEGNCVFEPRETCCVTPADCDDADSCTSQTCTGGVCGYPDVGGPGCCTAPAVLKTSWSPAPPFEATSTSTTIGWSVLATDLTPSPPAALYLGDRTTYDLSSVGLAGVHAEARLRLGDVPPGADLELKLHAYVDLQPNGQLAVLVRFANGTQQELWRSILGPNGIWFPIKRTAAAASSGAAELVLTYDGAHVADLKHFGALIDDLQVRTACGTTVSCTNDLQCATGDPCTPGRCLPTGQCVYGQIPGCCNGINDCPPETSACFERRCLDHRCIVQGRPGCCTIDADCGLNPDPCRLAARCEAGTCTVVDVPLDCDDNNPCTADQCISGACLHTAIPGCCVGPDCVCTPDVASWDFDSSAQGWTFDPAVNGYGWRRIQVPAAGNPRVLYYGNPDAGFAIDPGVPVTAVATSPPFSLPASAQSITVSWRSFVGLDQGQPADTIRLEAMGAAGQTAILWQLAASTPRNQIIALSSQALSGFGGQTVRLRLVYVATDNLRATGLGFMADDIVVTAVCDGPACLTPLTCPQGPPCTTRTCTAGVCGAAPVNCDDNDFCTSDLCDATTGQCVHLPSGLAGCPVCQSDAQCSDGDTCTRDRCAFGQCLHALDPTLPGCGGCQTNAQCGDNDPCTFDLCRPGGVCDHLPTPNAPGCSGCQTNAQCGDGDPCTIDQCRPDGSCSHALNPTLPGCGGCQIDADCTDNDPCTTDQCRSDGTCRHAFDPGLPNCTPECTSAQDCYDGQACTQDVCTAASTCLHLPIPGCCQSNVQCNDGDVCTTDLCSVLTGICTHTPVDSDVCAPTCVPSECNDGNPCTADSCNSFTGACDHTAISGCCTTQAQCADQNYCTRDQCTNHVCTHALLPLPGCQPACTSDAQCEDGNPCTTNRCGADGSCLTNVIFGCCDNAADCNDNNACTTDTCFGSVGVCFNAPKACNDNNACTFDSCNSTTGCTFTPDPECCTSAAQCDDGDACTSDGCAGGRCVHATDASCCSSDADCTLPQCAPGHCTPDGQCLFGECCEVGATGILCDDGDSCTQDSCGPAGVCGHVATSGCCTANDDCPASVGCTVWTCDAAQHQCVSQQDPNCCQEQTLASYPFSTTNLAGWNIQPAQSPGAVTWWVSTRRFVSSPSALYMGNPVAGNYDNGGVPKAQATTPALTLPASAVGLEMSFKVWLDVETYADFDPFFIDVVRANGSATTVWTKAAVPTNQYRTWVSSKLNLTPYAGQTIRVRFRFEADDQLLNQTEGIFIDDVVVRAVCSPVTTCNGDGECNDGDACTTDRCVANVCQAQAIVGCCQGAADCNDAYACTTDTCVNNKCLNALIPSCCVFDGECNDNRACTSDHCNAATHSCVYADTGGCCASAADCDDGDGCTSDICQANGNCYHGATLGDPSCCVPGTYFSDTFPSQVLTNFTVSGDGSAVRWRIHNGRVFSSPFAMYYGNPVTSNYDTGARTYGTATSGDVVIPASAHAPRLTFYVWLDLGSYFFDDLLSVRVLAGGNATTVWERTELPFESSLVWIPVDVALPQQVIGRTIRVQFAFDSIDEEGNDGEGIYIDNVVVSSSCAP